MREAAAVMRLEDLPLHAVWLRPLGLVRGKPAASLMAEGEALSLAGGPFAFTALELLALAGDGEAGLSLPLHALRPAMAAAGGAAAARIAAQLEALTAPRAPWAGLVLDRPHIMGVVNVTPDSFSDGGDFADPGTAIAASKAMLAAGATVIDVGGESTRPGAAPLAPDEERRRVEPVVAALAEAGALVSIDTRNAAVMGAALDKGARIVNDVTALTGDAAALSLVAKRGAALVLMHMQGEPRTMQKEPAYRSAAIEVSEYLAARLEACEAAGIPRARILVDPGIGFGKNLDHNLQILERLALLHATGCGILLGVSRKSFIHRIADVPAPKDRLPGSLAAVLAGLDEGAQLVRVHDVAETRQAVAVAEAIRAAV